MNRATPQMRDFAARLIAFETAGIGAADPLRSDAFAVPERMRTHLTTLMGSSGHRALLMRALTLAGAEVPWLRCIHVAADGLLEGSEFFGRPGKPNEKIEGEVVLVAQLIGLLVAFIGERLTLQIVSEVWPQLPAKDLKFRI